MKNGDATVPNNRCCPLRDAREVSPVQKQNLKNTSMKFSRIVVIALAISTLSAIGFSASQNKAAATDCCDSSSCCESSCCR
jgi:hypothetical protein